MRLPSGLVQDIDRVVASGRFPTRTEVIRTALEQFIEQERQQGLDEAIAEGYRRVPDAAADAWVDAATRAMVSEEPW